MDKVHDFLHWNQTCVLATVNAGGNPQAATVGFSHDKNFNLFIGTNRSSRKYSNIRTRPEVAAVIGTEGPVTVQYEGVAREISVHDQEQRIKEHIEKVPGAQKFVGDEGQTWFLISPTWLRYYDTNTQETIQKDDF